MEFNFLIAVATLNAVKASIPFSRLGCPPKSLVVRGSVKAVRGELMF